MRKCVRSLLSDPRCRIPAVGSPLSDPVAQLGQFAVANVSLLARWSLSNLLAIRDDGPESGSKSGSSRGTKSAAGSGFGSHAELKSRSVAAASHWTAEEMGVWSSLEVASDLFLYVIYNATVGRTVLSVQGGDGPGGLVYAHCTATEPSPLFESIGPNGR